MIKDYLEIRNAEGMPKLVDATVSTAFLLNAKNDVRSCAIALTDAISPEVRTVLKLELDEAIRMHEAVSILMLGKGWLHPVNLDKQFQMDRESSETAMDIAKLQLFPGDTSRSGLFATLDK
jgi:spore coat protein CotF